MVDDYFIKQAALCSTQDETPTELYEKYDVKKGLRDKDGKGVVTGLTHISRVDGFEMINGVRTPIEGRLIYRGYDIKDFIIGHGERKFSFEEATYLLLFGELPTTSQLEEFKEIIANHRELPTTFLRGVILKAHSKDIMNSMTKSVLSLGAYDDYIGSNEIPIVLKQCISLISVMPMLAAYGYQAYRYYDLNDSLIIHRPDPKLSVAENLLMTLRQDGKFTELEAKVLDAALVLHMEHGGGNNSTFTARVVTSAGSDTYAVMAAALSSLKGPKHGGANIKVVQMIADIKKHIYDTDDEEAVRKYLIDILDKKAFDKAGLIYGMGHAVYSISDPRAEILRTLAERLAVEKGREKDLRLYQTIVKYAPDLITERKHAFTGVSANVDMYSGFVYDMLGIPEEMFTPIFAIARIVGWSAHRIEELVGGGKIIRPAYISISPERKYVPIEKR
ncbi:MAG: citrate/2-methylcitrate synthase [Methanomassiliicoccales archaeon]|uniref:citrate/2-methylcitrate synthase n=1 Tax=Candidatus Methanarcanum hacksteinii TaxID=2911857 RepID=UPI002A7D84ED|nr:citrate/2-methylcitrate synthase [Candidatus Methanomethylophilaceae archaeon]MCI6025656.1 citrate/2-methylcitrate synthase [Methanomassiliicoccales archaeon]MDD7478514.1 citrate/2-methylcitrate synthase [Methanomassiliicoccales archaeon]MDY4580687.1 citrate/2-methylcitrate synthase [Candidatus Methanarcanum hacksteinii]TQS78328.1 MAG: citrate synthase [Candidatus Methanarcanum hacksteinii]